MKSYKKIAVAAIGAVGAVTATAVPASAQQDYCDNRPIYDDDRDVGCGYEGEDPTFRALIADADSTADANAKQGDTAAEPQD